MAMLEEVGCTLNFRGVYMRVVETCREGEEVLQPNTDCSGREAGKREAYCAHTATLFVCILSLPVFSSGIWV